MIGWILLILVAYLAPTALGGILLVCGLTAALIWCVDRWG